jgi:phenylalanyl-tRNA synthetase beta chain
MKFSESWLREWVEAPITTKELSRQLTMAGLEVDGIKVASNDFSGLVVGEVLSAKPHPNADNLKICEVSSHLEYTSQIVCGATNVRPGIKVPFATVGSKLNESLIIKSTSIRGIDSFGMLCGSEELGIDDNSGGLLELPLDAPVGEDLHNYLKLNDNIIDLDLTPNRGDCLSIRGIAREVATLNQVDFLEPEVPPVEPGITDFLPVKILNKEACFRYIGRVIKNVDMSVITPIWLKEKLRRSGLRSVDLVVDITNYVMLELGQPMHAFDLDKLDRSIVVRMATEKEPLKLLDGSDVTLNQDTLVIADKTKVLAIAGIMGGADSSISHTTKDIFLESACFSSLSICGRSRFYGKNTESSHRFERGVDRKLQEVAIERATSLLLNIGKGEAGPVVTTESKINPQNKDHIILRKSRLEQQLGLSIPNIKAEDILKRLGFSVSNIKDIGWECSIPSWRHDISVEADLIEEIARIYGYENLPVKTMSAKLSIDASPENKKDLRYLRNILVDRGYNEAITYSFVDPSIQSQLMPKTKPVSLVNPITADMSEMRTTLLSGLLPSIRYNLNRQQERIRIFETGLIFESNEANFKQQHMISAAITGQRMKNNFHSTREPVDFFDIKGDVESVLKLCGCFNQYEFIKDTNTYLHPGQSAKIVRNGECVGWLGQINPVVQKKLNLTQAVFVFELNTHLILDGKIPKFTELSKFPEIKRDLCFIVDADIHARDLIDTAREKAGKILIDVQIFDVYQGKGIEISSKSIALGLTFGDSSRTLEDNDVNGAVSLIIEAIGKEHSGILRG